MNSHYTVMKTNMQIKFYDTMYTKQFLNDKVGESTHREKDAVLE